jgi:hypothetical protein
VLSHPDEDESMTSRRTLPTIALTVLALCALFASSANAELARQARADATASAFHAANVDIPVRDPGPPPGAEVLNYKFGPMKIKPGQNLINVDLQKERPDVNGYVVGFRPGLVYAKNGKSPSVKVVHLHHAVWLVGDSLTSLKPTFAAGEEKTNFNAPPGYGWRYTTDQTWVLNHMIHDLIAEPQEVYLTYTLYFIPDTAPEAANIKPIDTQWMDVQGIKPYPVFNALKGSGTKSRFTYPTQAPNAYRADGVVRNRWVADHDATLVSTAGHLHPGGLWTDLNITRDGVTKRIFRSRAHYFEPAGNVSWDVAMSATSDNWKVAIKKGDILTTTATYDTSRASWYEVMGIMVVGITNGPDGGVDPFTGEVDQTDYLTHGRLKENIDSGVRKPNPGLHNPIRLRTGPYKDRIVIKNFIYSQGDLSYPGKAGRPPAVQQGKSLTFVNEDAPLTERFHTITACKAPCNLTGGIGYPLANGAGFDSGELGFGPTISMGLYAGGSGTVPITAVVNKPADKAKCRGLPGLIGIIANGCVGTQVYKTPKNLSPGTYSYFCRIHPFMRGAFRVVKKKS